MSITYRVYAAMGAIMGVALLLGAPAPAARAGAIPEPIGEYLRGSSGAPLPLPAGSPSLARSTPPPARSTDIVQNGTPDGGGKPQEEWGGLPPGPGREEVFYTCQACHSLLIVKQQRLSRSVWEETLEWMVEEQGMTEPDAASRERILDYLADHFGSGSPKRVK